MKRVTIDNVSIGQGRPKIIVPIIGKTRAEIIKDAKEAGESSGDLVEWRIDFYEDVEKSGAVSELSKVVKQLVNKSLLITFRTFEEGGERELSYEQYVALYQEIINEGHVDLLDIELFIPEEKLDGLIQECRSQGIYVVLCNHDFGRTPPEEEIIRRLELMESKGADICKIAVMPQTPEDVLTLLKATHRRQQFANVPLITMSMGSLGMISRLSGEVFGSAATFGFLGQASAPGQMAVEDLAVALNNLSI